MKLLFKQRFFSWFDSYDIYDEAGNVVYVVKGQLAWGHCLKIYDATEREVGMVKEEVFTFLPKFAIYQNETYMGCISKEWSFLFPKFNVDYNGWHMEGDVWEWDYEIVGEDGIQIAQIYKKLFNWTDTYVIDLKDPSDSLAVLMLVLAIDAEKCSRQ